MTGNSAAWDKIIPEDMKDRKEELVQECLTVGKKISQNMFIDEVKAFAGVGSVVFIPCRAQHSYRPGHLN